jgi:hypothetical protein
MSACALPELANVSQTPSSLIVSRVPHRLCNRRGLYQLRIGLLLRLKGVWVAASADAVHRCFTARRASDSRRFGDICESNSSAPSPTNDAESSRAFLIAIGYVVRMPSLYCYRSILLGSILFGSLVSIACGNDESDPDATGGAGGEASLPCEAEDLYDLGYEAKVALCDQVTSCYGPGEEDFSCYLPAGSSDGGVGISTGERNPADAVLEQISCMCQSAPKVISAYTRCAQQADDSLRRCIESCPEDPGACADEYVITCNQLRQEMNSLMQVEGECYQGPPREEMGGGGAGGAGGE